jgi:hypothetical protein
LQECSSKVLPLEDNGDALRIKREQHDPSAEGWSKVDGVYAKTLRRDSQRAIFLFKE